MPERKYPKGRIEPPEYTDPTLPPTTLTDGSYGSKQSLHMTYSFGLHCGSWLTRRPTCPPARWKSASWWRCIRLHFQTLIEQGLLHLLPSS